MTRLTHRDRSPTCESDAPFGDGVTGFDDSLAGEKDAEGRCEAAIHLAEGGDQDRERNVVILKQLLADDEVSVRVRSAASLLILGQDVAQRPILEWLASPNRWEMRAALIQLERVKDGKLLVFASRRLEAIAADTEFAADTRAHASSLLKRFAGR